MNADQRRTAVVVAASALLWLLVLWAQLAGTFIVGTCAFLLMRWAMRLLERRLPPRAVRPVALVCVVAAIAALTAAASMALKSRVEAGDGFASLLNLLADTLERLRSTLPAWIASKLPASATDLQHAVAASLRSHAANLQRWGHQLARGAAHVFIGTVVGMLAALESPIPSQSPWLEALRQRGRNYLRAFSGIVLAQLRIAAVNTALTAAFLLGALPLADVHVPFAGLLVVLTFVTGLLPIVGNLLSNAAILLAALTVSPGAAAAALVFLLVVHKLEYILNAHFVGRTTRVPAAVLLAAMVFLEAVFGLPGLVIAPIACAWAFGEARDAGLL